MTSVNANDLEFLSHEFLLNLTLYSTITFIHNTINAFYEIEQVTRKPQTEFKKICEIYFKAVSEVSDNSM